MTTPPLVTTLPDGRMFPVYEGEVLAWSPGLYQTLDEEHLGYPRARAVLRAMRAHRPEDLLREYDPLLWGIFGAFAGNARRGLALLREECPEFRQLGVGGG